MSSHVSESMLTSPRSVSCIVFVKFLLEFFGEFRQAVGHEVTHMRCKHQDITLTSAVPLSPSIRLNSKAH